MRRSESEWKNKHGVSKTCFLRKTANVLRNAQKRPHFGLQTANLKLQFAAYGWENKPVAKGL